MTDSEIMQYYSDLMRLASSRCHSQADAEDLVGDTLLAAFSYLHKGGSIASPKTWLTNTFFHKYHDRLRQKYRSPVTVCWDEGLELPAEGPEEALPPEEAARVRKTINRLAYTTREVLIRFYYGNQSVAEIAQGLSIPDGTVKSRLSAGRNQMRKGLETMEIKEQHLPGRLHLTFGGSDGWKGEPLSLVEGDLIAQNLLMLAYEKPITVSELSKAIGIPAAYIEPIIQRLVDGELMVQTDSGRIYSDLLITRPQDALRSLQPQLEFAHRHFDTVWGILQSMTEQISQMSFMQGMDREASVRLERYAILKALQDFQFFGTGRIAMPEYPKRKDGGSWVAHAMAFDAGYRTKEYQDAQEYAIWGGHRTTRASLEGRNLRFCEFDTTLWDCPCRYGGMQELYFKHIIPLLWHIHNQLPLEHSDIPNELITYIPNLERFGLLDRRQNQLQVAVPVLDSGAYGELCRAMKTATEQLKSVIGEQFADLIASLKAPIPKHLTSVPELFRYECATRYVVMAIVREAYRKGLHLKGVTSCCPPAVLIYGE